MIRLRGTLRHYRDRLTPHIRLTSLAQISATPKLRICPERYAKSLNAYKQKVRFDYGKRYKT
jgi:hypothetical protein